MRYGYTIEGHAYWMRPAVVSVYNFPSHNSVEMYGRLPDPGSIFTPVAIFKIKYKC